MTEVHHSYPRLQNHILPLILQILDEEMSPLRTRMRRRKAPFLALKRRAVGVRPLSQKPYLLPQLSQTQRDQFEF